MAYEQADAFVKSAIDHLDYIHTHWQPPKSFYHFRSGGHVAAVQSHLENTWFAKVDLKRFFEHVTRNRIIKRLCGLGYTFQLANEFAVVSTVKIDRTGRFALPFGFVQSPTLASLDMDKSHFGRVLAELNRSPVRLTVYVDDVIISGTNEGEVNAAYERLWAAAEDSNYTINLQKSRRAEQHVSAFNLDISKGLMRISAVRLDEFSEQIMMNGQSATSNAILGYIQTVNERQAADVRKSFRRHFP